MAGHSLGNDKLPEFVMEMANTACKYNMGMDVLSISQETKRQMPVWHHIAAETNYKWNKKSSKCLRGTHGLMWVGDFLPMWGG